MLQPDKAPDAKPSTDAEASEKKDPSLSEPGKFSNDPDDPTNPNEAIERHRRKLRP